MDEFVTEVLKTAQKVRQKKQDDITRYAVLSGLRPDIAKHVLISNPKTTDEVIDRAKLAELAVRTETAADKAQQQKVVTNVLTEVQLKQLCDEVARLKLSLAEVQAANVVRVVSQSPSTRRVQFSEDGARLNGGARTRSPSPRYGSEGRLQRNQTFYSRGGYRGRQVYTPRASSQQPQSNWLQSTGSFPRYRNTPSNIQCRYCGIFGHKIIDCRRRKSFEARGATRPQFNLPRNY